jgi:hypothetical protein
MRQTPPWLHSHQKEDLDGHSSKLPCFFDQNDHTIINGLTDKLPIHSKIFVLLI